MNEQQFFDYVTKFGAYQKRSMFGGIGLFQHDAMYVLVSEDRILCVVEKSSTLSSWP